MSEIIKRMARAIAEREFGAGCPIGDDELANARAALTALLEPTDEMVIAADDAALEVLNDHTFALKEPTLGHRVFVAAIEAALKPSSGATAPRTATTAD